LILFLNLQHKNIFQLQNIPLLPTINTLKKKNLKHFKRLHSFGFKLLKTSVQRTDWKFFINFR